jgi:hypothetical protein
MEKEQSEIKSDPVPELLLKCKALYTRLCLYIVNNIDIMSSETAMYLVEYGVRSEWKTNFLRDHNYSFESLDMDIYDIPIFNMDQVCYKLAKLMTKTRHTRANELYQLLSSISNDSDAIYSYDFVPDDYEETEADKQRHFMTWREDNASKYKEIELICKNILEKIK